MRFHLLWIMGLMSEVLFANGLNLNALGRAGVEIEEYRNARSVLSNPAYLSVDTSLKVLWINRLMMDHRSLDFLHSLPSGDPQEVAQLMDKHIGHKLEVFNENFLALSGSFEGYHWLLGGYEKLEGEFITHTGFGSMGAMEGRTHEDEALMGTLATSCGAYAYGISLRGVHRYLTLHHYSIAEIIKYNGLWDYVKNTYTHDHTAIGLDMGATYHRDFGALGISILDLGDTTFGSLDKERSRTNLSFSTSYETMRLGIEYLDLFHGTLEKSLRIGVAQPLDSFLLNIGILEGEMTLGFGYDYHALRLELNGYSGYYQLMVGVEW